jgi:ribosomal protein L7/L12
MLNRAEADARSKTAAKASKRDKFVELAQARTKNAIRSIRIIAKLGNKNAYEYSEADVKKIANALNREVEAMKNRMSQTGGKDTVDFSL